MGKVLETYLYEIFSHLLTSDSRILEGATGHENCRFRSLGLLLEDCKHEYRANGMNVCVSVQEISHFFECKIGNLFLIIISFLTENSMTAALICKYLHEYKQT